MKADHKPEADSFLISLSDIALIIRRSKKKIAFVTVLMSLLAVSMALTKPVLYQAESTFQMKSSRSLPEMSSSFLVMMAGLTSMSNENEASAVMKSRTLLKPVIETLGLQASLSYNGVGTEEGAWSKIFNNLWIEFSLYRSPLHHALDDFSFPLTVSDASYSGEVPSAITLRFMSDRDFEVFQGGASAGVGELDSPFVGKGYGFTLHQRPGAWIGKKDFTIALLPLPITLAGLAGQLKIVTDKSDASLLKLEFRHRDRHIAGQFLNQLMREYEKYLQRNLDEQSEAQLAYLQRREKETIQHFTELMKQHADILVEDISNIGFADSQKEMEFLTQREQRYQDQLMANQLEIKRIQNIKVDCCGYYDLVSSNDNPAVFNGILEEIRNLKQQRNGLELAIHQNHSLEDPQETRALFTRQIIELTAVQQEGRELKAILEDVSAGKDPDLALAILNDPGLMIKPWIERLNDKKILLKSSASDEKKDRMNEWRVQRDQFIAYLENLQRINQVREKVIQERFTHRHNPDVEFQGIDLKTAHELYINYSRLLNDTEANIRQYQFVVKQVDDPAFELSSLSATLGDPVSQETIMKASQLIKDLHDENNRSSKEQDRLKEDLSLHRNFLSQHLQQSTRIAELTRKLYEEKIRSLQNVTLELINRQITMLNKNLAEYLAKRLENLHVERELIQQQMDTVHLQMATLPKKWVTERLIEQELDTNRLIVEEVTKLVEKKNISHNLQVVQSAPLDAALIPINPASPRMWFYLFAGAFFGCFLGTAFVIIKSIINGIPATPENLLLAKQYVAGRLSAAYPSDPIADSDLSTLRRLDHHLHDAQGKKWLLIEGKGPEYSSDMAELLTKQGLKVIRLLLNFDTAASKDNQPGILQYLDGTADIPKILSNTNGDLIIGGGICRYSAELFASDRFLSLLEKLQPQYDLIIAVSNALPLSAEAGSLAALFTSTAVTITDEQRHELLESIAGEAFADKKVAFLFAKQ